MYNLTPISEEDERAFFESLEDAVEDPERLETVRRAYDERDLDYELEILGYFRNPSQEEFNEILDIYEKAREDNPSTNWRDIMHEAISKVIGNRNHVFFQRKEQ